MNNFESDLDTLLALHTSTNIANATASQCRTESDWRRAHTAEEAYQTAYDSFLTKYKTKAEAREPKDVVDGLKDRLGLGIKNRRR